MVARYGRYVWRGRTKVLVPSDLRRSDFARDMGYSMQRPRRLNMARRRRKTWNVRGPFRTPTMARKAAHGAKVRVKRWGKGRQKKYYAVRKRRM